jgi:hypothetical protein
MDVSTFLGQGFFPKELPPSFTTRSFSKFVDRFGPFDPAPATGDKYFKSKLGVYNLARPGGRRRRLHIPNPFGYYRLCRLLDGGWERLEKQFSKSQYSVSIPVPDATGFRALVPRVDGGELSIERARVRSAARFILRTDISRFYSSIYTHSIPWALEGKTVAKSKRIGGLANDLDAAYRELQDGQTFGIPIGPDASLVTAEVIACAVDKELKDRGFVGMRFMDDYELGFDSRSAAEAALADLEEVLSEFELAINPRKTSIDQLPVELDRQWNADIKAYPFSEDRAITSTELVSYFNRVFQLKSQYSSDAVLAYAVARLRLVKVEDWALLQNLICQCALAEPGAMEHVVALLQENSDSGLTEAIDGLIHSTISYHAPLSHGSEVAWALWAAIWFKRSIPTPVANKLVSNRDSAVGILALHARELGLIKKSVALHNWAPLVKSTSLYGPEWLLAYEADVQGWVPSATKTKFVENDPNFSQLKQQGVSFYDPNVAAPTKSLLLAEGFEIYF